jgi:glycosyltransferase involved in cell wall biosynthesis
MIAVLMMYRNEEDIIGQCIEHWANLGVDEFFLCNNLSTDNSHEIAVSTLAKCGKQAYHLEAYEDIFPQRYIVNYLKHKAFEAGHQWLFPIDADEFLNLNDEFEDIEHWLIDHPHSNKGYTYGQYQYKNIMPNGVSWFEPEHKKVFGRLNPDWNISIGNHEIEGVTPFLPSLGVYLDHYQYRSYDQFKRKKLTFFRAFEKAGYLDHKFMKEYRMYQKHGEAYLDQMWDYLLRGVTEFEFKP